jgi:hypothetical protein
MGDPTDPRHSRSRTCPAALDLGPKGVRRCDRIAGHAVLGQDGPYHRAYSRPDWQHVIASWTDAHPCHVAYLAPDPP